MSSQAKTSSEEGLTKTTLFVRKVPLDASNEEFSEYFSQFGPLRSAFLVTGKKEEGKEKKESGHRGFGFVHFADAVDMQKCLEQVPKMPFRGRKQLKAEVALRKHIKEQQPALPMIKKGKPPTTVGRNAKNDPLKAHRLIIRNIPFGTKEADLQKLLAPFGKVLELTLPKVKGDEKKIRGFAFVQMFSKQEAAKAMEGVNGSEFHKRTLAVDWSLSKDFYKKATNDKAESSESEQSAEELNESEDETDKKEQEEKIDDESVKETEIKNEDEYKRTVFVRNLPFDTSDEVMKKVFSKFGSVKSIKVVKDKATGFARGSAFIQFTTSSAAQKAIEAAASTNNPTQTPTMKHVIAESILVDADRLETAQEGIVVDGRALYIFPALERNAAEKLIKQRNNPDGDLTVRDKRHLYLVNEGLVRQGAPTFPHWTSSEVEFRSENVKARLRQLKKDLNLTVSQVRLSVRHLPTRVDEKQVRAVFAKAVDAAKAYVKSGAKPPLFDPITSELLLKRKPRITQVKIVCVTEKEIATSLEVNAYNQKKHKQEALRAGRSKGFGFVQFREHVHAMAAVRWLTNWGVPEEAWAEAGMVEPAPNKATIVKWPIVEFATEKLGIVKARQEREKAKKQVTTCVTTSISKRKHSVTADSKKRKDATTKDSSKKFKKH